MAKDLFSRQTKSYARYRPTYPEELFNYIMGYTSNRNRAWDCGTGNGQAAIVLGTYFSEVKATDISNEQLACASSRSNLEYLCCPAENTPFPDSYFDLITVAQAYHWFNFSAFEKEVHRVSKRGGIIAIWGYNLVSTNNQTIDKIIKNFYTNIIGPFWDAERKYVEQNYATIPFNFPLVGEQKFSIERNWSLDDMTGYLNSWSAVQNFISAQQYNPVEIVSSELGHYWKKDTLIPITFPVFVKLGSAG